jgi:hypothetical protein
MVVVPELAVFPQKILHHKTDRNPAFLLLLNTTQKPSFMVK